MHESIRENNTVKLNLNMYLHPVLEWLVCIGFYVYLTWFLKNPTFSDFVQCWAGAQLLGVLCNAPHQRRYYKWWYNSDMTEKNRRGFSSYGALLLGCVQLPALSPLMLDMAIIAYIVGLFMLISFGITWYTLDNAIIVWFTFISCLFYHSSLWSERSSAWHRSILTLVLFFYIILSPELYDIDYSEQKNNTTTENIQLHSSILLFCLKLHLSSIYCISVLQKLGTSIVLGNSWPRYAPHAYLWKSIFAKPNFPRIQKFLFLNQWFMHIGGWFSLIAEGMLVMQFFIPHKWHYLLYLPLITFHLMAFLAQGVDYISFWVPFLLIGPIAVGDFSLEDFGATSYWPMLAFLGFQLIFALFLLENFIDIPPFTSTPMFVIVSRLDDKCPQHYVLSDEVNSDIKYDRLEWMYPYIDEQSGVGFNPSDVESIPFKYIGFGFYQSPDYLPTMVHKWFNKHDFDKGFYITTNMKVPNDLLKELQTFVELLHSPNSNYNPYTDLRGLYERYEACRALFQAALKQE
eukprot:m.336723 g.336723  ORF g.336723 m.336723 type:complete len:516 (-) comp17941_c0_seq1:72-1619(-)